MKIEIEITDEKIANFSDLAQRELKAQICDISNKLIDEAGRVEASERLSGDVKEVTSSIVRKASELFLRRYNYNKKTPQRVIIDIVAILSMSLTGVFFTIAFTDFPNHVAVLCVAMLLFAVGAVTSVISVMNKI